tara:strand:- start:162 stop:365 length:204 start_codon:yes stop_codon:yes gene_type:complete
MIKFAVGDLVLLKKRYLDYGKTAVITKIDKSTMSGDGGWICFAYQVVTESGELVHITESCIEKIIEE